MKILRWFLGRIILFFDRVFAPKAPALGQDERARREQACANLSLYQFEACPFCVKVRRYLKSEGLSLPLKDATKNPARAELLAGGGKLQTPCLRIAEPGAPVRWLYESNDIIAFLRERCVPATAPQGS